MAVGMAATGLVIYVTRAGVGMSADSVVYVQAGRNLAEGRGLTVLNRDGQSDALFWFPPLYPMLIGAVSKMGMDATAAARWVNAVLCGMTAALVAALVLVVRRCVWCALLAVGLLLATVGVLDAYCMAWSEPAFVLATLGALACLGVYVYRGGWGWLLAGAGLVGAAMMARYIGAMLLGVGVVLLLLPRTRRIESSRVAWRRVGEIIFFLVIASAPLKAYQFWSGRAGSEGTGANFIFIRPRLGSGGKW